jgi:hypothetical protein
MGASIPETPALHTAYLSQGWTGEEVVFLNGSNVEMPAYRTATGSWRLAPAPGVVTTEPLVWTGDLFVTEAVGNDGQSFPGAPKGPLPSSGSLYSFEMAT